jgi:AraC-like DNA-binding protein
VAERRAPSLAKLPSALGLASRLAYQHARGKGVAVRPLLRKARLTDKLLEDVNSRVPVRDQIEFLNLVAVALGDDMLGFHLALDFDLRLGGLFYYVLASSGTLGELFERGARYTTLVNEGVSQKAVGDRRLGLAMRYRGIRRQDDRHQMEFWMATLVRACRECTGLHVKPVGVRLTHDRARGHAALSRFLGCNVEFGAPVDEILFAHRTRELRIIRSDPFLNKLLVGMCEEVLARRPRVAEPFVARVENALAPLLPHGDARATQVASRLGFSQRTFARRLSEEGLTFSGVLNRLRLDLARRYLVDEKLSISKVAWLLGYQEVGAFSHAFRRWTGRSPSDFARRPR